MFFRPIIPLLISMMAGIAGGTWFPGFKIYAILIVCLCLIIIAFSVIKRRKAFFAPTILFFAAGYLSIQPWISPEFPLNHVTNFENTHGWKIVGVIDSFPTRYLNREKLILKLSTLGEKNKTFPVSGRIRLMVAGKIPDLVNGDKVLFYSRIRSIRNFNNPGGFDYRRYMAFQKVYGSAYVSGEKISVLSHHSEKGASWIVGHTRQKVLRLIENINQQPEQKVLKALIIGDKNSIPRDVRKAFNRTGIGHILAISGLHIGIVATAAFFFFKWILSYFNLFLRNAWTKKGAVILSFFPVLIYGLLSGMSPSTQRAVIMITVFLMAFLFESEPDPLNTLAWAAMVILVAHPPSLFSISFQLSFAAVLAIIYGFSKVPKPWASDAEQFKKQLGFKIKIKLYYFFMSSVFAILGTLPLVMYYFNQVSLVGLGANFILVPMIGFIVVPLGLTAVFLYPVTFSGALICLKAGAFVLSLAIDIVYFIADMPFAAIKTITPNSFEIVCYYILLGAALNIKRVSAGKDKEPYNDENEQKGWLKRHLLHRPANLIFWVVALAMCADIGYWLNNRLWHDDFRVTMIDVGQGNSALLELPYGYNMLIDGGGFSDNRFFDMGANVVAPFLWQKKIKTIDTLVLSHPNSDHLNGLIYIGENFNVKQVWTNNEPARTFGYKQFMDVIEKKKINMVPYNKVFGIHIINGVRLNVLYPPVDFDLRKKRDKWRDFNNDSVVLKASMGTKSFLFPGDIQARAEYDLSAAVKDKLKSTVLLAPHHGSKTSSTTFFLNKVNPSVVVISYGWKNRFGFPHPSVIKRYKKRGCRIYDTADSGAINLSTDGRTLSIKPTFNLN